MVGAERGVHPPLDLAPPPRVTTATDTDVLTAGPGPPECLRTKTMAEDIVYFNIPPLLQLLQYLVIVSRRARQQNVSRKSAYQRQAIRQFNRSKDWNRQNVSNRFRNDSPAKGATRTVCPPANVIRAFRNDIHLENVYKRPFRRNVWSKRRLIVMETLNVRISNRNATSIRIGAKSTPIGLLRYKISDLWIGITITLRLIDFLEQILRLIGITLYILIRKGAVAVPTGTLQSKNIQMPTLTTQQRDIRLRTSVLWAGIRRQIDIEGLRMNGNNISLKQSLLKCTSDAIGRDLQNANLPKLSSSIRRIFGTRSPKGIRRIGFLQYHVRSASPLRKEPKDQNAFLSPKYLTWHRLLQLPLATDLFHHLHYHLLILQVLIVTLLILFHHLRIRCHHRNVSLRRLHFRHRRLKLSRQRNKGIDTPSGIPHNTNRIDLRKEIHIMLLRLIKRKTLSTVIRIGL